MIKVTLLQKTKAALFRQLDIRRENSFLRELHDSGGCDGLRYVAYIGCAGLANRLRAHVIASVYAERTGRILVPCWSNNSHLGCAFSDLFDFDALEGINYRTVRRVDYLKHIATAQGDTLDYPENLVFFKTPWQYVNSEYLHRAARPFCDSFWRWVKPRAELLSFVERSVAPWPQNLLGVHVRRGDFVTHTGQAISQSRYIVAMGRVLAEMPEGVKIFLTSDAHAEELQEIYDAFPGRILPRIHKSAYFEGVRGSLSGARGSLVDMLLLSRASRLILTPGSTFGEFAAQMNNVPVTYA